MSLPVIAVTCGDHNGIGPEVALKAVAHASVLRVCRPLLVGPWGVFRNTCRKLRFAPPGLTIMEPVLSGRPDIRPGVVSASAGRVAAAALRQAAGLSLRGVVQAMVTAPVSKNAMHKAGIAYPGQTEFLRDLTGAPSAGMMLVAGKFRVGLLTIHVPLRDVSRMLSRTTVREKVLLFHRSLRTDWAVPRPRLALLGINPHAGEMGDIGDEDERVLKPAIRQLRMHGVKIEGPFPADAFFARRRQRDFDAVIASYHDQGLIPLKMSAAGAGVNVTVGLPVIRTSPDHGTAFDIAGKGIADPSSMITAIRVAATIIRHREDTRGRRS